MLQIELSATKKADYLTEMTFVSYYLKVMLFLWDQDFFCKTTISHKEDIFKRLR
jgi:hypothetical protein